MKHKFLEFAQEICESYLPLARESMLQDGCRFFGKHFSLAIFGRVFIDVADSIPARRHDNRP